MSAQAASACKKWGSRGLGRAGLQPADLEGRSGGRKHPCELRSAAPLAQRPRACQKHFIFDSVDTSVVVG